MGNRADELEAAAAALERVVAGLVPEQLDGDTAVVLLTLFARRRQGRRSRPGHRRRADRSSRRARAQWPCVGRAISSRDTAGVAMERAATTVEVGRRLAEQPLTDEAFRHGELSLDQAGLISEAVEADPTAERELLDVAGRETVRTLRTRTRGAAVRQAVIARRYTRRQCSRSEFRHGRDRDGIVWGRFLLPPDTGVAVVNAIESRTDRRYRAANRATRRSTTHAQFAADALTELVTGSAEPATKPAAWASSSTSATLRCSAGDVGPGEICRLESGDDVPVSVARAALDDAFVKAVLVDGTEVRKVKHFGRRIPAAVRTALHAEAMLRDGIVRCTVPGLRPHGRPRMAPRRTPRPRRADQPPEPRTPLPPRPPPRARAPSRRPARTAAPVTGARRAASGAPTAGYSRSSRARAPDVARERRARHRRRRRSATRARGRCAASRAPAPGCGCGPRGG